MFKAVVQSSSRNISGFASSSLSFLGEDVERRTAVSLLLARTEALLLALEAVRTAFARFVGNGFGLSRAVRAVGVVVGLAVTVLSRRETGFVA